MKILVIPLRFIGDTILSVPLIRNLSQAYPEATIDVMTSAQAGSLLEPCPYIGQTIKEPRGLDLIRLLSGYDMVFLLRKSMTMAMACKLAGVKTVVGYDKQRFFEPLGYKRWGWFLDIPVPYPGLKTQTPQAVSHLGFLTAINKPIGPDHLELWTTEADEQHLERILAEQTVDITKPMAVIHISSASHGKSIAIEKFVESVQRLSQQDYQVLCTGTASDEKLYHELARLSGVPLINLAGKTSLRETFALYTKIQVLVTVDSSPIHLGAAAGVPHIVGVFGPTNEKQWGPYNSATRFSPVFIELPCRPCYAKICSHNSCRVNLTAEQIAQTLN